MFDDFAKILKILGYIAKLNDFTEKPLIYEATAARESERYNGYVVKINSTINGVDSTIILNGVMCATCARSLIAYADELRQARKCGAKIIIRHILLNLDGLAKLAATRNTGD